MFVSEEKRVAFIHIPKCGGSAIYEALEALQSERVKNLGLHVKPSALRNIFADEVIAGFKTYAVVRNPYDWLVSLFLDYARRPETNFDAHAAIQKGGFGEFIKFFARYLNYRQVDWTCDPYYPFDIDIIRFEDLRERFSSICKALGVETSFAVVNATGGRPPYASFYTAELQSAVAGLLKDDICHFSYEFGQTADSAEVSTASAFVDRLLRKARRRAGELLRSEETKKYYLVGVYLSQRKHFRAAEKILRVAVIVEPDVADCHFALSECYRELGNLELQKQWLDSAIQLSPTEPIFQRAAAAFFQRSDTAACIAAGRRAIELEPTNADWLYGLSFDLALAGKLDEALVMVDRAIAVRPSRADFHAHRRAVLMGLGRYADGIAAGRRAVKLESQNADWLYGLSFALARVGDCEEALDIVDQAIALDDKRAQFHAHRRSLLTGFGRYEDALTAGRRAIELEPNNADWLYGLSFDLMLANRIDDALESVDRAIALAPDRGEFHAHRRSVLTGLKRYEQALQAGRRALELDPNNAEWIYGLSFDLMLAGKMDEALIMADRAIIQAPDCAEYRKHRESLASGVLFR